MHAWSRHRRPFLPKVLKKDKSIKKKQVLFFQEKVLGQVQLLYKSAILWRREIGARILYLLIHTHIYNDFHH